VGAGPAAERRFRKSPCKGVEKRRVKRRTVKRRKAVKRRRAVKRRTVKKRRAVKRRKVKGRTVKRRTVQMKAVQRKAVQRRGDSSEVSSKSPEASSHEREELYRISTFSVFSHTYIRWYWKCLIRTECPKRRVWFLRDVSDMVLKVLFFIVIYLE
jgi:hypothetical protein